MAPFLDAYDALPVIVEPQDVRPEADGRCIRYLPTEVE